MRKLNNTTGYLVQWCQNCRNHWINEILITFDWEINVFLHNHLSNIFFLRYHLRKRTTVLEQCSHRGSVAVDEGTN